MKKQQGIILITVLIFLLLLALLSVSALTNSQLQTRISYNVNDVTQTLLAAEAGLSAAEQQLSPTKKPNCLQEKPCKTKLANISVNYFIEPFAEQPCRTLYKITAQTNNSSPIVVQSIYAVASNTKSCDKSSAVTEQLVWRELN